MASIEEIRAVRLSKLNLLIEKGINPYPITARQDLTNKEARDSFDALEKSGEKKSLVGRIMSMRSQGKIVFFDFNDGTANFQALAKKGEPLNEELFDLFVDAFDIGDFVEVSGTLFKSKKDEM